MNIKVLIEETREAARKGFFDKVNYNLNHIEVIMSQLFVRLDYKALSEQCKAMALNLENVMKALDEAAEVTPQNIFCHRDDCPNRKGCGEE